jgi:hypothetical protein
MDDSFNQCWSARDPWSNVAMNPTPASRCSAVAGYRGRSPFWASGELPTTGAWSLYNDERSAMER